MQKVLAVGVALGTIAEDSAVDRRTGDVHHPQPPYNRFVERLAVKAVRLAQEQLHHLGFALQCARAEAALRAQVLPRRKL